MHWSSEKKVAEGLPLAGQTCSTGPWSASAATSPAEASGGRQGGRLSLWQDHCGGWPWCGFLPAKASELGVKVLDEEAVAFLAEQGITV